MKMNLMHRLMVPIQLAGITFVSTQLFADGYRNPPPTAEGIAKAGAHSVFVDDASAVSYNPANLGMQTGQSLVVAATFARAENTYTPFGSPVSFSSDADWNVLPNLYYAAPVADGMVVGLGVTTPYGQSVAWNAADFQSLAGAPPFQSPVVPYDASILLVNFNPTFAIKLGDSLFLGAGVDIMYSALELNALLDASVLGLPLPPGVYDSEAEGHGWGVGGNVGLTWLPTERQRVALTYRSRVDMEYKGDFSIGGMAVGDFKTKVKYPNRVGAGYGLQLTDDIQVEMLVEWLQWSVNDVQPLEAGLISMPQNNDWNDTFTFGLGGSWNITDALVARAGYSFLETPIPDNTITPLLVDTDRHVISAGLGYSFGPNTLELSYAFSIYEDRTSPVTGSAPGAYEIDSNLVGMTYSLNF